MPNGQPYIIGGQVIIERVGRNDGGEYQCWDNSLGLHIFRSKIVNVQCKCRYLFQLTGSQILVFQVVIKK